MCDMLIYGKANIKYYPDTDITDIVKKYGSKITRISWKSNKEIVCEHPINPKTELVIPRYNKTIIEQFHYLDNIVIEDEYELIMQGAPSSNVTVNILTIDNYAKPINYKVKFLRCSHVTRVVDIGENLEIESFNTDFCTPDVIQDILDKFKSIDRLGINGGKLQYLDKDRFSNIRINFIRLDLISETNIDIILANPYVTKLEISGSHNCTFTYSENRTLRKIKMFGSTLNGEKTIPQWVEDNAYCYSNRRFKTVKPIMS
jgi:hypothetical protein